MCFSAQVPLSKLPSLVYFCSKLHTAETPLSENQSEHSKLKFDHRKPNNAQGQAVRGSVYMLTQLLFEMPQESNPVGEITRIRLQGQSFNFFPAHG